MKADIIYRALEIIKNENTNELENINEELKTINISINNMKREILKINKENINIMNVENFKLDYKNMIMLYIYILVMIFLMTSTFIQIIAFNIPLGVLLTAAFYKVYFSFYDYVPKSGKDGVFSFIHDFIRLFISKRKLNSKKQINDEQIDKLNQTLNEFLEKNEEYLSIKYNLEDELSYIDGNIDAVTKLNTKYNIHDISDNAEVVKFITKKKVLELK